MAKAENTFKLIDALRKLFAPRDDYRRGPRHVDPALVTFARLGLLAYYC